MIIKLCSVFLCILLFCYGMCMYLFVVCCMCVCVCKQGSTENQCSLSGTPV